MKTKKFNKTLVLKRETISNLDDQVQGSIKGGKCSCQNSGCNTYYFCYPTLSTCPSVHLVCMETDPHICLD